jgi:D-tyrosyl-tRNA(Tyr) deacylase
MKIIIQRVLHARVEVEGRVVGAIQYGMLVFLGVSQKDTKASADYLVNKIIPLRIFEDDEGKMNLSSLDKPVEFLVVSQFTLYGNCDKGRRPSFDEAADPQKAEELYYYFVTQLRQQASKVETGQFRAMMEVSLTNDGPVTFVLESPSP